MGGDKRAGGSGTSRAKAVGEDYCFEKWKMTFERVNRGEELAIWAETRRTKLRACLVFDAQ